MRTEFYIARRLSNRRDGNKAGVMERVATIATAVSLAVVIVTLSVVVGFKEELNAKISGSVSDVVITAPESRGVVSSRAIKRNETIEQLLTDERIEHYSAYRSKEGVVKSDENIVGVLLKGIDSLYNLDFYRESLTAGELPRLTGDPRSKDILMSQSIARKMDAEVGDRVEMVFIDANGSVLRDRFAISGIYRTGVDALDNAYIITDIRNVARLYEGNDQLITGYEVWLKEGADREAMASDYNDNRLDIYLMEGIDTYAFAIDDIFYEVFSWLATHDVNAVVIVVIMIIVALLNMTTALLIIVFERKRMIGELRALGMRRRSIIEVFLYRAMFIVVRGVAWGAVVGIAIALAEHYFHLIPLSAEEYMLDAVPAALCWGWWVVAIAASIIITYVVMLLPAAFSARISPSETMRYE
ncbi:MAG: ABC transporter permease [Alistipes sp.]|nr:ABC transporter permease [Alistipes sp.]